MSQHLLEVSESNETLYGITDSLHSRTSADDFHAVCGSSSIFIVKTNTETSELSLVTKINMKKVTVAANAAAATPKIETLSREKTDFDFYTCCWVRIPILDAKSNKIVAQRTCLLVGGKLPILLLVDVENGALLAKIEGHGKAVMHAVANPKFPNCFATASEDTSARVWRLHLKAATPQKPEELVVEPLYVLAGVSTGGRGGHRASVLSVAWSPDGYSLCTAGMDFQLKVWAQLESVDGSRSGGKCVLRRNADRWSGDVLHEYIDCVRWVSPALLVARGSTGRIRFVAADSLAVLTECRCPITEAIWFIKFAVHGATSVDAEFGVIVAVGDHRGRIHVFRLGRDAFASLTTVAPIASHRIQGVAHAATVHIRDLSFNSSGDLLGVVETGKIFCIPHSELCRT